MGGERGGGGGGRGKDKKERSKYSVSTILVPNVDAHYVQSGQ